MFLVPRAYQVLHLLYGGDAVLEQELPGGVHKDALPQDTRAYPALVFSFAGAGPSPNRLRSLDLLFQVAIRGEGTDADQLIPAGDRVDYVTSRLAAEQDGITFAFVRKSAEVSDTRAEGGVWWTMAGFEYVIRADEGAAPLA